MAKKNNDQSDKPNKPDQPGVSDEVLEYAADGARRAQSGEYKDMGWKGFEDPSTEEEEELDDVSFGKKEPIPEDELDMTPMVDVTFLLLIFFMVTASFSLQKSIQQPPAQSDEPSTVVDDREIEEEFVKILIDENNTYYVTTRSEEEVECPSDREMRTRVKQAKELSNANNLQIVAHVDSYHKKLVSAWDAGIIAGLEDITIETTDEEF